MEITIGLVLGLVIGGLPLLSWLLWWWNELWFVLLLKIKSNGSAKLPPGHMGLPFFGETLAFLWYFKFLRRPDEFIDAKRRKYGEGEGMFRTHLFGSPSIITYLPPVNQFVYRSERNFILQWPNVDLVGPTSLVAVHGSAHARLRRFVISAINRPDALRRIALHVQPRMVAALNTWSQASKVNVYEQIKKVTFENIGILFASYEPGPLLDDIEKLFHGMIGGVRAYKLNVPGTSYHHALQCRRKLETIFKTELEKKKSRKEVQANDLMDGLMKIEDDEGQRLSDQEVIDNIVSLVAGGYESTSLSSMWAFYYLAKYPHVLAKLREENMTLSKKKKEDFITSDDVMTLKYTNKVVEEVIRLANVSAFIFRLATEDVEYKGYKIPKNWRIIIWLRYSQTNPENFEDPLCFNPDRWNEAPKPGTYLAFGGGSRICAGNMLARLQIALLLHHLSIGYKWELLNPEADMIYLPHSKPADGVEVSFSKL